MRYRYRRPLRSNAVLTLLGTFLILTASAASDALAAGTWSTTGSMTVNRAFYTATLLTDGGGWSPAAVRHLTTTVAVPPSSPAPNSTTRPLAPGRPLGA